jgi:hypothetical protein
VNLLSNFFLIYETFGNYHATSFPTRRYPNLLAHTAFRKVTPEVFAFAALIGVVALPGAFLARAFVERMPVHIHTAILDVAVIAGGTVMISSALRSLL